MMKIKIPRRWYLAVVGLADWRDKARHIPFQEYQELKEIIDRYLSKINKSLRKRGALVGSLFWSQENLAPLFLLEATRENEKFLKETRVIFENVTEKINASLTIDERQSNLGKNLGEVAPEGKILLLECTLPSDAPYYPTADQLMKIFSEAFNSEFLTIKRSEHDLDGRKNWLAALDSLLNRDLIREVGPVKKLREVKEIEGKRLYAKTSPGDFEKISRVLSEAVPFRPSLFEVEQSKPSFDDREALGHIIIQYLATKGDIPIKLKWRSVTHQRLGRKIEEMMWVLEENLDWKELDKLHVYSKEIAYDKVEKVIADVGGINFDALWSESDFSNNIFFMSKFSFSEDVLKELHKFTLNPREQLSEHIGPQTTAMFELWQKAGLNFNILIFEVRGLDSDEDRKLIDWIKDLKNKQSPGPNYSANNEVIKERHYRPF
jgi:hypothetical protein